MVMSKRTTVAVALLCAVAACSDLSDVDLLVIDADGSLSGLVYRDLNGNQQLETTDEPAAGVTVELRSEGGANVLHSAITDVNGQFVLQQVDVGAYEVGVDPLFVADSLVPYGLPALLSVRPQSDTTLQIGLTYHLLSIPEARAADPGRRVLVEGIALNRLFFPGDDIVHISTGEGYLRILEVESGGPSIGDSVRIVGTTALDQGQPVLTNEASLFQVEGSVRFPTADLVSTGAADEAQGGTLDAALVEVRGAVISSTSEDSDSFYATASDGSGALRIRLKGFLGYNTDSFTPGRTISFARGLLVPAGGGRWDLTPRGPSDIATVP